MQPSTKARSVSFGSFDESWKQRELSLADEPPSKDSRPTPPPPDVAALLKKQPAAVSRSATYVRQSVLDFPDELPTFTLQRPPSDNSISTELGSSLPVLFAGSGSEEVSSSFEKTTVTRKLVRASSLKSMLADYDETRRRYSSQSSNSNSSPVSAPRSPLSLNTKDTAAAGGASGKDVSPLSQTSNGNGGSERKDGTTTSGTGAAGNMLQRDDSLAITLRIEIPHVKHAVHVTVLGSSTVNHVINVALTQYQMENKTPPLRPHARAYELRLCEDNGEIDTDMPPLTRQAKVARFGTMFALVDDLSYVEHDFASTDSGTTGTTSGTASSESLFSRSAAVNTSSQGQPQPPPPQQTQPQTKQA